MQIVFFVETSSQTGMNIELLKILGAALASRQRFLEIGPSLMNVHNISTVDLAASIAAANECIDSIASTLHSCLGGGTELFSPKKFHLCCSMQQQVYFEFSVRRKMRRVKEEDSGGKDTPSRSTTTMKTTHQKISVFLRRRILTFLPIFEDERSWLDDEWLRPFRVGGRFGTTAPADSLRLDESQDQLQAEAEKKRVAAHVARVAAAEKKGGGVGQEEQRQKKRCCIS